MVIPAGRTKTRRWHFESKFNTRNAVRSHPKFWCIMESMFPFKRRPFSVQVFNCFERQQSVDSSRKFKFRCIAVWRDAPRFETDPTWPIFANQSRGCRLCFSIVIYIQQWPHFWPDASALQVFIAKRTPATMCAVRWYEIILSMRCTSSSLWILMHLDIDVMIHSVNKSLNSHI